MSKRVCIYARVSTSKQTVENQIQVLREYSDRCNYQITQIYSDNGISGAKGRKDRPALDQMMKDAVHRKFDMVLVWSVDRLGRSVSHLVEVMNELNELKIDLYFNQQSIDTSTSSGRMIFGIFGCISEMERSLISERVTAGLQRAVSQGKKLGRPSKMNDGMKSAVKLLREKGVGIKQIAKQLQIGVGTVYCVIDKNTEYYGKKYIIMGKTLDNQWIPITTLYPNLHDYHVIYENLGEAQRAKGRLKQLTQNHPQLGKKVPFRIRIV